MARVAALFVHPIKSAGAIAVDEMTLDDRGAVADRRWLVVDAQGRGITAREVHALALVRPEFVKSSVDGVRRNVDGDLRLRAPDMPTLTVSVPHDAQERTVSVWADSVGAHDAGDDAAQWLSDVLRERCRLVRLAESARRPLQPKYAGPLDARGRRVAFSDGAPLLLLSQASIDALSERIVERGGEAMTVSRFRPNVLLRDIDAHVEDTWREVEIGTVRIGVGNPCARCVMTTIDPDTGAQGFEPLRTMSDYRRADGAVMFGMNATNDAPGTLRVHDSVRVLR